MSGNSEPVCSSLQAIMDERDRAYQQRWEAQEKAVAAALSAAEKAVAAALIAQEKAVANAFNAQEKAVASALSAAERAVSKAETATEKRFDGINEFRAQMAAQNTSLSTRIDTLTAYKDTSSGKSVGLNAGWVYLVGIATFLGGMGGLLLLFKK